MIIIKIRKFEIILAIILAVLLLSGAYLESEQAELASKVVRLRVVANSDSEEDQALKLLVRDAVLSAAGELVLGAASSGEAEEILSASLPELERAAERVIAENGYDYAARATLDNEVFPTKQYEDFSLPAGEYRSLRVTIGEGDGENWWCVLFPPLCTASTMGSLETAAETGGLSDSQVSLITGDDEGYVIKFKAIELIGKLKEWLN